MRCETCNHRFTGRALYVWRGRQKVLFLDVPEGGFRQPLRPVVCQWCRAIRAARRLFRD